MNKPQMHPVPVWKYLVMTFSTMGFYILFWHYHNWAALKKSDKKYQNIKPFWRAVFYFLWIGPLLRATGVTGLTWPLVVGLSYALMTIILSTSTGLPLYLYGLAFLVCVGFELIIVKRIEARSTAAQLKKSKSYQWTFTNWLWSVFGFMLTAPLVAFFIASETLYLPPTDVIEGDELPTRVISILQDNQYLKPNETLKFYYSEGVFSYLEAGSFVTDQRFVSYSEYNGNWMDMATFDEIEAIYVDPGNFVEETIYYVSLSPENDQGFWGALSESDMTNKLWNYLEAEGVEVIESDIREEYYELFY